MFYHADRVAFFLNTFVDALALAFFAGAFLAVAFFGGGRFAEVFLDEDADRRAFAPKLMKLQGLLRR